MTPQGAVLDPPINLRACHVTSRGRISIIFFGKICLTLMYLCSKYQVFIVNTCRIINNCLFNYGLTPPLMRSIEHNFLLIPTLQTNGIRQSQLDIKAGNVVGGWVKDPCCHLYDFYALCFTREAIIRLCLKCGN